VSGPEPELGVSSPPLHETRESEMASARKDRPRVKACFSALHVPFLGSWLSE
jgi:hypothetical protein